jgi:hypothetical protein
LCWGTTLAANSALSLATCEPAGKFQATRGLPMVHNMPVKISKIDQFYQNANWNSLLQNNKPSFNFLAANMVIKSLENCKILDFFQRLMGVILAKIIQAKRKIFFVCSCRPTSFRTGR